LLLLATAQKIASFDQKIGFTFPPQKIIPTIDTLGGSALYISVRISPSEKKGKRLFKFPIQETTVRTRTPVRVPAGKTKEKTMKHFTMAMLVFAFYSTASQAAVTSFTVTSATLSKSTGTIAVTGTIVCTAGPPV